MPEKQPFGFQSAVRKAEAIANDLSRLATLLGNAASKVEKHTPVLNRIRDDLQTLFRLVQCWKSGKYRDLPWRTIVMAIAAIVYFVNPFDLVPDILPIIGYMDDATVVGFVLSSISADIRRFRDWEIRPGEAQSNV